MSGGSMDYICFRIDEAADRIQRILEKRRKEYSKGVNEDTFSCYELAYAKREMPNAKHLHTPEALAKSVIERLEKCLLITRKAAACALRVEWYDSDDDGPVSFCDRLDEELAKFDAEQSQTNNKE